MRNTPGAIIVTEDGERKLLKGGPASYATGVTPKLTADAKASAERKSTGPSRGMGGMGM
tara:strand:+ start:289 stop:465 length:177 start_codon:yes stop_codon:yes gene_type:complete